MKHALRVIALLFALSFTTHAQFNSGSTGADGALNLATCPTLACEVQLPESGILNYTAINVPQDKILRFKRNSRNTPAILLAQGSVTIAGYISLNAGYDPVTQRSVPGPGGFYGSANANEPGAGPGGGTSTSCNARWVGPLSLSPIVGGSGACQPQCCGTVFFGGSGGGALVIATSGSITMTGTGRVDSLGNSGSQSNTSFGSGGAIRFVANQLNISGQFFACTGLCGVIRLEGLQGQLTFTGASTPAATLVPFTAASVPTVSTGSLPLLSIVSIGGYSVPSYAGTRFDTVDILLPNSIPDPVNVVVQGVNIPSGTQVQVGFVSGSPGGTSTSCNLSGSFANSSCTATVSNLNRTGVTFLLATAAFAPPAPLAGFNPKGADHVAKVKLESVLGAKQKYVFLRGDNSVIDTAKVPKEFLLYYGM